MHRSLWRFFSSVNLSIWLLLAITCTLLIGSFFAKLFPADYNRLNFMRFQEWLPDHDFKSAWWIWLLFILLTLFGINTAACTAERLRELIIKRREYSFASFTVLVSPSVMHLCFLAIIGGHAISQFSSDIRQMPARSGMETTLQSGTLTVLDSRCSFRSEHGLTGMPGSCTARLSFSSKQGTIIRSAHLLKPTFLRGYSIHLTMAGKAKQGETPAMNLVIKKDPGLALILLGNLLLCILMIWYFPRIIRNRNGT
jgi:hypothetical protein